MTPHSGVVGVVPLFVVFLARHDTLQHCYAMQIASDFEGSCPTIGWVNAPINQNLSFFSEH